MAIPHSHIPLPLLEAMPVNSSTCMLELIDIAKFSEQSDFETPHTT